jgi:hypothetical protein
MPEGTQVRDAIYEDVDGDGAPDLVVAAIEWEPKYKRSLRIHLDRAGSFRAEPDFLVSPVWEGSVAYAVADVHPDKGKEVVLFSANATWVWRPRANEKERLVKLAPTSFLWQFPEPGYVFAWQAAVQDWNGDGRTDIVVPEPDGYRLLLQTPKGFAKASAIAVPDAGDVELASPSTMRTRARRLRKRAVVKFSLGGAAPRHLGPLLNITDSVPAPHFLDFDGDGAPDLLSSSDEALYVWKQQKGGTFGAKPDGNYELPVIVDRDRKLDVSFSSHAVDLNRDRRVDCVVFTGDQRSKDVRTQVQVFLQGTRGKSPKSPLFGTEGLPDQLLVLKGFAGNPRFDDVDGNGYPDLLVGTLRPDLIDTLRAAGGEHVQAELHVFLNRKGRFERRPDLTHRTNVQAKSLRVRRPVLMARFFGDVTGDGVSDLLLRDEAESLKVLMTRRTRRGLSIHGRALWELTIDRYATVRLPEARRGRTPELLILERSQILRARFD